VRDGEGEYAAPTSVCCAGDAAQASRAPAHRCHAREPGAADATAPLVCDGRYDDAGWPPIVRSDERADEASSDPLRIVSPRCVPLAE